MDEGNITIREAKDGDCEQIIKLIQVLILVNLLLC